MCGRYTLTSLSGLEAEFGLSHLPDNPTPRYNIAPGQVIWVVANATLGRADGVGLHPEPTSVPQLLPMRWGLVPSWAKDPAIGHRLINARSESAADKPAFRTALKRRRCLVVADGFYEWQRATASSAGTGKRQPYYIRWRSDDRHSPYLAMAGLWEHWLSADGSELITCAILTCAANRALRPIHHRMPVIVDRANYARWLDPAEIKPASVADLFRPAPAERMEAYAVSTLVNSPKNDHADCVAPLAQRTEKTETTNMTTRQPPSSEAGEAGEADEAAPAAETPAAAPRQLSLFAAEAPLRRPR